MDVIKLIEAFKELVVIANEYDQLPDHIYKLAESFDPKFMQYLKEENCERAGGHNFDPDEGFMCLECGKDGTEHVMSAAYDRAKDIRKYGP